MVETLEMAETLEMGRIFHERCRCWLLEGRELATESPCWCGFSPFDPS